MRIIREVAPTTRQALRGIRERLGEDAVILSSRRVPEGVEITAGADTEVPPGAPEPQAAAAEPAHAGPPASLAPLPSPPAAPLAQADRISLEAAALAPPPSDAVGEELRSLRCILETQVAQLAWTDLTRRLPVHAELLRELTEMGLARELASRITEQLPAGADIAHARRFAFTALAQYLPVSAGRWSDEGGRVAFIGTTGVGKTTSLAKIAVRWALRHGPRELALVSADSSRIGAQDELRALGQLLGAPVYVPDSFAALPALVAQMPQYRLVLIDTPGASLRDAAFPERLAVLANHTSEIESVLVLSANTQAASLEEIVRRFEPARPGAVLLTKLDEAASLGGSISALIRAQLSLCYVSEGQRIPEDLRPARALDLVSRAVALAKESGASADEDLLRRRFGKVTHARA